VFIRMFQSASYIRTYAKGSFRLPFDPSTRSGRASSGRTAAWYSSFFVWCFSPDRAKNTS